jgi:CRISPR-associated endoribonuclease Cas6
MGARWGIGKGRRFGNGRFEVEGVSWIDAHEAEKPVYDAKKKVLSNCFKPITIKDLLGPGIASNGHSITVNYLTPTRITFDHQLHPYPEFHVVIRNLLRRLSNLAYFHCGQELKLDFRGIIEAAKEVESKDGQVRWRDWERYSARQDVKMTMGGFVGEVEYRGEVAEFVPLMKLGQEIHLGKGTAFGLGKYTVVEDDPEQRARAAITK